MRLSLGDRIAQQDVECPPARIAAARRIGRGGNRNAARAVVSRKLVVLAGRIVELLLRGAHKNRLLHHLAVINLRARQLQARRLDLRRRILDQQHGQPIRREFADRRQHHAIAVRVHEVRVDPARAGARRQLIDIQLARREQHLAVSAIDGVAVHVGIRENIIRPQRLDLRDGVMERAHIPQAHVVEGAFMQRRIDGRVGMHLKLGLGHALLQPVSRARGVNVRSDERPLDGDFIGPHIQ